jgi:hypothetical protein
LYKSARGARAIFFGIFIAGCIHLIANFILQFEAADRKTQYVGNPRDTHVTHFAATFLELFSNRIFKCKTPKNII